ncbi:Outer membrane protein A [Burkholderiales bacterium 8X]|nr:Outer membrane protein A [Burkholderiales bacterium 8X]
MKTRPACRVLAVALASAATLVLAGCASSLSKGISDDGRATEVVFPDVARSAWQKEGTFPNLDNLRLVGAGASKDQLYDLIGRPHFREGAIAVREWDYVFNFREPSGGVVTCQFKAIFDKDARAQSFHWAPAACADRLKPAVVPPTPRIAERPAALPIVAAAPTAKALPPQRRRIELSADALFKFGKSSTDSLQDEGRRELDGLAASLGDARDTAKLKITGHTDRLGSPSFNQSLSLARAISTRDYLAQSGIPAHNMQTFGRGMSEPKVQCAPSSRILLIECLAPNRRVEIEVSGER